MASETVNTPPEFGNLCECKTVEHSDDCLMDCLTVMTKFREVIQHCFKTGLCANVAVVSFL